MSPFDQKCPRCLDPHPIIRCPYVKAVELQDGDFQSILRVEFLTPADYGTQRATVPKDESPDDYPKLGPKAAA